MSRKSQTLAKEQKILKLLGAGWDARSTNWIAQKVGASWSFVQKVRTLFELENENRKLDKRESKNGKMYVRQNNCKKFGI